MLPQITTPMKQLAHRLVGLSVTLALFGVSAAVACDTPVYRYAMYRWEPAPYEIYYFHDEPIGDEAAKLHEQIDTAARSEDNPANVMFVPVPLKEDTELKRIPPDVKAAWLKQETPAIPSYMVVSPLGVQLHLGDLDNSTLESLLDSQARGEIATQLEEGKACVMVLVTGTDQEANGEAEQAAKTLIKDIADGKVELYMAPPMYGVPGEDGPEPPKVEIGYVKVRRDDPKEKWLVESLLSIESDLKDEEFVDKAMVFGVFGRGRALPPFVGKGINPDNLLDCVDFVTGACSCTVKDQNPGMDLLFTKDWWTAAENLADAFGSEEGNEPQYGAADFFPQLMIPADDEEAAADDEEESTDDEAMDDAATVEVAANDEPVDPAPDTAGDEQPTEPETAEEESIEQVDEEPMEEEPAEEPTDQEPSGDEEPNVDSTPVEEPTETKAVESEPVGTETIVASEEEDVAEEDVAAEEAHDDGHAPHSDSHTTSANSNTTSVEEHGVQHAVSDTAPAGILVVGAGIAIALLLLFALTFVVLRPK